MNARDKKPLDVHPDEWGFYNPDEAGFAAVIKRIGTRGRAATRKPAPSAATSPTKTAEPIAPPLKEAAARRRKPRARLPEPKAT